MRLINVQTLLLEEYADLPPPYAILSHTWGHQELDYHDFQDMCEHEREDTKLGNSKIGQVCRIARQHGYGHVWVDTCCIDRSSSADLSEAVNSMYRYYQDAQACYVYLVDFATTGTTTNTSTKLKQLEFESSLRGCRWFTRGWTLQELIAPQRVTFYDQAWACCGEKTDPYLLRLLSSITSIDEGVLENLDPLTSIPVCKRMSWAADRRCTRQEDLAYSLLGIFDVNLPLIYGEGAKAFSRLQEEISRRNLDLSLLAWHSTSGEDQEKHRGLLAKSPSEFWIYRKFTLVKAAVDGQSEVVVINGCLRVSGKVLMRTSGSSTSYILDLGWIGRGSSFFWRVGILLRKALGAFVRAVPQKLFLVRLEDVLHTRTLHLQMHLNPSDLESLRRLPGDLGSSSQENKLGLLGPDPSRFEYEWGSYASTGCRTKQIATMFDHGLCLDMRDHRESWAPRSLEPWSLRPTLFWRVWSSGGSSKTSVKVFLRYYCHPMHSLRREGRSLGGSQQQEYGESATDSLATNVINPRHPSTMKSSAATTLVPTTAQPPPRKRRRDGASHHTATTTNTSDNDRNILRASHPVSFPPPSSSRMLACPFYLYSKLDHTPCKDACLRSITDVQQHLATNHVHAPAPYCPVCGTMFNDIAERDAHIVRAGCKPAHHQPSTTTTPPDSNNTTEKNSSSSSSSSSSSISAMTDEEYRRISNIITRASVSLADFEVWYKMWEELFPRKRYPPSVWLGSETEEIGELTSLIWNRFVAGMRAGAGGDGDGDGDGCEAEDADATKHFEMSQLSSTTSSRTGGMGYS